jgi:hypothetical protein
MSLPDRDDLLARLHARWRLVMMMPLVYLLGAAALNRWYLVPHRGGRGFLPLGEAGLAVGVGLGAALVGLLWVLMGRLRRVQREEIALLGAQPHLQAPRLVEQLWMRLGLCDLAAGPGLILFLLDGNGPVLLSFLLISLGFYLREMPRAADLAGGPA